MAKTRGQEEGARLSPDIILDVALDRVRSEGIDFSMRDIADDLGVWPMATYRHFENRDALISAIVDFVLGEVMSDAAIQNMGDRRRRWQGRIREFCLHAYDILVQYPGVAEKVTYGLLHTPNGLRLIETMIAFLNEIGLPRRRAAVVFQSVSIFVTETATLEYARFRGDANADALVDRIEDQRPVYPEACDFVGILVSIPVRDRLKAGLDLFIAGVSAELADR